MNFSVCIEIVPILELNGRLQVDRLFPLKFLPVTKSLQSFVEFFLLLIFHPLGFVIFFLDTVNGLFGIPREMVHVPVVLMGSTVF